MKAIIQAEFIELVRDVRTGQPINEKKSKLLQVRSLDTTLGDVLAALKVKGCDTCIIAFETEPYDSGISN